MSRIVFGLTVLSAMALAFATTASATTLEVGGTAKNSEVTVEATLASGSSGLLTDTFGVAAITCTSSTVKGHTSSPFTGTTVGGPLTALSVGACSEGLTTVDTAGSFTIERIGTTTNGTVRSTGAKITAPSFFGVLTCTTSNTDIGTLTGVASGKGKLDINAVISCTVIGTTKLSATYTVTSPEGLGVTG